jgi:hypothetical protein
VIYVKKDALSSPIINNYQIFVNEKGLKSSKKILFHKTAN